MDKLWAISTMSAVDWIEWVEFVRANALAHSDIKDKQELAHALMRDVARRLVEQ